MSANDSVVLFSPADELEAQAVLSLLSQRGIPCRLEPRGVTLYPTALGNADVVRVRRGDLPRAQGLLDQWQGAAAEPSGLDEAALASSRDATEVERAAQLLATQRELFTRFGPVSWERGVPWALCAVGALGVIETTWGAEALRPTAIVLWLGVAVVGALLLHPAAGLRDAPLRRALDRLWALDGAGRAGDCGVIPGMCQQLLETLPRTVCPWLFVNSMVNNLITCGHYAEALGLLDEWSAEAQQRGEELDPEHALMARLNAVEALYNLGRLDEARRRLDALPRDSGFAVVDGGVALQQGWLCTLEGDPAAALEALSTIDEVALPREYRAELHFARAHASLRAGDVAAARQAVEVGLSVAVRAPSERNALFLAAAVERADENPERAAELYADAAAHPYRGQGGEGLLAWAELCRELGEPGQAQEAVGLLLARDPQSDAATRARTLLANA